MKSPMNYFLTLIVLAGISCQSALGGCTMRGYSSSYGHNNYSYHGGNNYNSGYNNQYHVSSNYGYKNYKTYYPTYSGGYGQSYAGYDYWAGGYYGGDTYYQPGNYYPGYYKAYKSYEYPVFVKYTAVAALVEFPSYGAYYVQPPPSGNAPTNSPLTYNSAPAAANLGHMGASASPAANPCPVGADNKLDQLLALTKGISGQVTNLESRVLLLESSKTGPPTPTPNPPNPNPVPEATTGINVPQMFHTNCAACHESKVADKLGKKFVMFVDTTAGTEMASIDLQGKPIMLNAASLKKIEKNLVEATMPPETDKAGKPVKKLALNDRNIMINFIRQALAAGPSK